MPIASVGLGRPPVEASWVIMLVPETSVDEYDLAPRRKDEVWISGQVFPVQPVAVPHTVHEPAHGHFRLHVLTSNAPHVLAAPLFRNLVGHSLNLETGSARSSLFVLCCYTIGNIVAPVPDLETKPFD